MEPVTYFITFGTAILGYLYFVITKREYTFSDLRESIIFKRMFKLYVKVIYFYFSNNNIFFQTGFDIDKYFELEYLLKQFNPEIIEDIEEELLKNQLSSSSSFFSIKKFFFNKN